MARAGIEPTGVGARFAVRTSTRTLCVTLRPPGSLAVTVTVAAPWATPVSVKVSPDTAAVTMAVFLEVAS